MERVVQPEQLDQLPADHPQAIRSHRDLRHIHFWMGNPWWVARSLQSAVTRHPPRQIIDLGAGDGTFLLRCLRRVTGLPRGTELVLVDQRHSVGQDVVAALRAHGWNPRVEQIQALDWLESASRQPDTWIFASLFLHHFEPEPLRPLLARIAEIASLVCACEPRRSRFSLAACRLLPFLGANSVTRHDAAVSVRAGFRDMELSRLWPAKSQWCLRERRAGMFSHLLVGERSDAGRPAGFPEGKMGIS
jgi:hypothetical protein